MAAGVVALETHERDRLRCRRRGDFRECVATSVVEVSEEHVASGRVAGSQRIAIASRIAERWQVAIFDARNGEGLTQPTLREARLRDAAFARTSKTISTRRSANSATNPST